MGKFDKFFPRFKNSPSWGGFSTGDALRGRSPPVFATLFIRRISFCKPNFIRVFWATLLVEDIRFGR
jgi:hypothetical protein